MNQNAFYPNQTPVAPVAAPAEMHFCFKCRWEGRTMPGICPRCGRRLFSQTNVRVRGVAMTILGLFLSGFMGTIAFFVTTLLISAAKDPKTSAKFNGDEQMLVLIYMIF